MGVLKRSVYTQKQAEKVGGKFVKKYSATQRKGFKLTTEQAKEYNSKFDVTGRFYELDEKATKAYLSTIKGNK